MCKKSLTLAIFLLGGIVAIGGCSATGGEKNRHQLPVEEKTFIVEVKSEKGSPIYKAGVRAFAQDDEKAANNVGSPYVGISLFDIFSQQEGKWLSMRKKLHAWDNREHQFWKGRQGPKFSPRGCATRQDAVFEKKTWKVWVSYVDDMIETTITWRFGPPVHTEKDTLPWIYYDVAISIKNIGDEVREGYSQFFANYGHEETFFWTSDDRLTSNKDLKIIGTMKCLVSQEVFENKSAFDKMPHGREAIGVYTHPVMVSEPKEDGYRHVICCSERIPCYLTAGMEGYAMDYMISPFNQDLGAGESFTFRARHYFARLKAGSEVEDVKKIWDHFQRQVEE